MEPEQREILLLDSKSYSIGTYIVLNRIIDHDEKLHKS